jgi:hypothetical protein
MDWKFWKPEKQPGESTANWPVDIHLALRQLLDLYQRADALPFSSWNAPGIEFAPSVRGGAQAGVRGYQLALWFWLFAEKHGGLPARMARESFCLLANAAHPGSGDSVDALLDLENRLAHAFETISAEQRTFEQDGLTVQLPMEFFLASAYFRLARRLQAGCLLPPRHRTSSLGVSPHDSGRRIRCHVASQLEVECSGGRGRTTSAAST